MKKDNYINGEPAEFGRWDHIVANIQHDKIMSGQLGVFERLEWAFARYNYIRTPHYFYCYYKEATDLIARWTCPSCKKVNMEVYPYDHQLHYQSLVEADDQHSLIVCDRCDLNLEFEDIAYYVKCQ